MPREYVSTRSSARSVRPTCSRTSLDGRLGRGLAEAVETGRVAQVLATGQPAVEAHRVGQVADPALDQARLALRVEAHHPGLAARRLGQAEEHQDRRRLAGAVLAEQAEDLAPADDQVEVVDRGERPVALGQPTGPDDDVVVRAGTPDRRLGTPHRRPNRRKVHHRPSRTIAISATPTAPHRSDVSTVTRMSAVALAADRGRPERRHVVAGDGIGRWLDVGGGIGRALAGRDRHRGRVEGDRPAAGRRGAERRRRGRRRFPCW